MNYPDLSSKIIPPEKIKSLYKLLECCSVCPRKCKVNRLKGEIGYCGAGLDVQVSSFNLHFGEEPPISGWKGSGTIFFTHCNLKCCYCQNYPISNLGNGNIYSLPKLANVMLNLEKKGAHNINLVTPTHFTPQIVKSLELARKDGLKIPIVYNCGGYESEETLKFLEGIVDIYMPDAKYANSFYSKKYSNADNYFEVNKKALKEMYRQVGNLYIDKNGIAQKGILIRHLVLPGNVCESKEILKFIKEEISPDVYLSIMSQYHPCYKAFDFSEISQPLTAKEYQEVLNFARKIGLKNIWSQPLVEW